MLNKVTTNSWIMGRSTRQADQRSVTVVQPAKNYRAVTSDWKTVAETRWWMLRSWCSAAKQRDTVWHTWVRITLHQIYSPLLWYTENCTKLIINFLRLTDNPSMKQTAAKTSFYGGRQQQITYPTAPLIFFNFGALPFIFYITFCNNFAWNQ